jgi:hypothetical protein
MDEKTCEMGTALAFHLLVTRHEVWIGNWIY